MTIALSVRPARTWLEDARLSTWLGLVAGLVLPVVSALLFSTYEARIRPDALENARHLGFVYLAGEIALILHARRRGLDLRAIVGLMPHWAKLALGLFLGSFWISSAFVSWLPACSLMLCLSWVIHLVFAASLFHLARRMPAEELTGMWRSFALGLAALAVIIAVHFTILPGALRGHEREVPWVFAIPGFMNVRLFGSWTGGVLALLTGLCWTRRDAGRQQRLLYLATALAFALTFWTTTRAALLGWACVLPVAWLVAGAPRSRSFYTVLPVYLLAGTCLTLPLQPYGDPAYSFFDPGSLQSADGFTSGRLTLWKDALTVAMRYPLLGSGTGSSWWMFKPEFVHPHNFLVQFLLNWGLIPTIPALVLLGGALWGAHRAARRQPALLPFALMADCLVVEGLFDGMLHFAQFIMLIVGCLAICLARPGARREALGL